MLAAEELTALHAVLEALSALDDRGRERVMIFVLGRLGADPTTMGQEPRLPRVSMDPGSTGTLVAPEVPRVHDIRGLKETKAPRTAVEMAVLVAYYLSELAPDSDRKDTIQASDLERYFKQAQYPLPNNLQMVLPRGSDAGYFEGVERGKYRLNRVGYNLAVHTLPAAGASGRTSPAKGAPKSKPKPKAKVPEPKARTIKKPSSDKVTK